jgi:uncharacterized protein YbaA (DUF1428 family)
MESPYADFYAMPLPKRNVRAYRTMASAGRKLFLRHGALEYREYVGEDLRSVFGFAAFPATVKARRGDTVICAIVGFRSRAHRDLVMKRIFSDPKMSEIMPAKPLFDMKRMVYGGFTRIV